MVSLKKIGGAIGSVFGGGSGGSSGSSNPFSRVTAPIANISGAGQVFSSLSNPSSVLTPSGALGLGAATNLSTLGLGGLTGGIAANLLGGPFKQQQPRILPSVPKPDPYMAKGLLDENLNLPTELQLTPDTQALEQFRSIALGDEVSPWAATSLGALSALKDKQADMINARRANDVQQLQANMASRRGIDAGSRSLIQDAAKNQGMIERQMLRRQEKLAEEGIRTQDAGIREQMLEQLPQLELAQSAVGQQNIMNRLMEKRRMDEMDRRRYSAQMGNFAREQQANAIRASKDEGILGNIFGSLF